MIFRVCIADTWVDLPLKTETPLEVLQRIGAEDYTIQEIESQFAGVNENNLGKYTLAELNYLAKQIDDMAECEIELLKSYHDIFDYEDIQDVANIIRAVAEFNEDEARIYNALLYHGYKYGVAVDIVTNNKYILYDDCARDEDLARQVIMDMGGICTLSLDTLIKYFDYSSFGFDIALDRQLLEVPDSDSGERIECEIKNDSF